MKTKRLTGKKHKNTIDWLINWLLDLYAGTVVNLIQLIKSREVSVWQDTSNEWH